MSIETMVKEVLETVQQLETSNLPMFFDDLSVNIIESHSFKSRETVLKFVKILEEVVMKQRKQALN